MLRNERKIFVLDIHEDEEYRIIKARVTRQHPINVLQGVRQGTIELGRGFLQGTVSTFLYLFFSVKITISLNLRDYLQFH
jgi:hypothetical protein